jgi:hypothetical protein
MSNAEPPSLSVWSHRLAALLTEKLGQRILALFRAAYLQGFLDADDAGAVACCKGGLRRGTKTSCRIHVDAYSSGADSLRQVCSTAGTAGGTPKARGAPALSHFYSALYGCFHSKPGVLAPFQDWNGLFQSWFITFQGWNVPFQGRFASFQGWNDVNQGCFEAKQGCFGTPGGCSRPAQTRSRWSKGFTQPEVLVAARPAGFTRSKPRNRKPSNRNINQIADGQLLRRLAPRRQHPRRLRFWLRRHRRQRRLTAPRDGRRMKPRMNADGCG